MHTGQYYYDQMPLYYRRQYRKECKRQHYNFRNIMRSECYGFHHLIAFDWHGSEKGMEFWHLVAQKRFDELDLNRPFARWFKDSYITQFINKNAISLVSGFGLLCIVGIGCAIQVATKDADEIKLLKAQISRRDSINLINRANHIVDSTNAANALYYGGNKSKFKGVITLDSANKWMDKVMDENKVKE